MSIFLVVALIFALLFTWAVFKLGNHLEETFNPHDPKRIKPLKTVFLFYTIVSLMLIILINLFYLEHDKEYKKSFINKFKQTVMVD